MSLDKKQRILSDIQNHVSSWITLVHINQITITKLNGLSNACYKVSVNEEELENTLQTKDITPQVLLYREFLNQEVNMNIERALFKVFSE